jgi:hypothetical protein
MQAQSAAIMTSNINALMAQPNSSNWLSSAGAGVKKALIGLAGSKYATHVPGFQDSTPRPRLLKEGSGSGRLERIAFHEPELGNDVGEQIELPRQEFDHGQKDRPKNYVRSGRSFEGSTPRVKLSDLIASSSSSASSEGASPSSSSREGSPPAMPVQILPSRPLTLLEGESEIGDRSVKGEHQGKENYSIEELGLTNTNELQSGKARYDIKTNINTNTAGLEHRLVIANSTVIPQPCSPISDLDLTASPPFGSSSAAASASPSALTAAKGGDTATNENPTLTLTPTPTPNIKVTTKEKTKTKTNPQGKGAEMGGTQTQGGGVSNRMFSSERDVMLGAGVGVGVGVEARVGIGVGVGVRIETGIGRTMREGKGEEVVYRNPDEIEIEIGMFSDSDSDGED